MRDQPLPYAQSDTARVQGLPTADNRWSVQCLNCQTPLNGPFCSNCGQRAIPPHPTMRQLAGDAISEFSGWDGKFVETLRVLMLKPGELTRQWLEGRRVHFISPWRVYLSASLVYFLVVAAAPELRGGNAGDVDLGVARFGVSGSSNAARLSEQAAEAVAAAQPLTGAERDSAIAQIGRAPAIFRPMMRRAIDEPAAFKNAVQKAMPNVFLALIPVLGLVLSVFYRRRNFPEHLYFAVHLAAFVLLMRAVGNLALFTRHIPFAAIVQVIGLAWIATYTVKALRRVYGGGLGTTIFKAAGVGLLYSLIAAPVVILVAFVVASV